MAHPKTSNLNDPRVSTSIPGNCLVTGGAGFIGSHLCERLLEAGHRVICLDNFNDFYDPSLKRRNISNCLESDRFSLVPGDILNVELLDIIFSEQTLSESNETLVRPESLLDSSPGLAEVDVGVPGFVPDTVVHLAAMAGVRPSLVSPTKYVDVDVKGTVNLLEEAREHGVDKFVFGSSSSVYGINEQIPFSEDHVTDLQVSPYAAAKKSAEQYCKTYHHLFQIPCALLRFFTVYGPRQRPEMAIQKFTRLMAGGNPVPMYGDGTSARDYTYVDDVVNGIVAALEVDLDFEIYNLGNSETVELRRLIQLIGEALGVDPSIDRQPEQPGDVPITFADISKARRELGYNPEVSIEEGIQRFVDWYRASRA